MPSITIKQLAEELNQRSATYRIGGLQKLRVEMKGLHHSSSRSIFSSATTFDDWAFHHGGRSELQFNIGLESIDGAEYVRHGVAFSLETSRSLPDIEVLVPKIRLFNEYIQRNEDALSGFQMWHFRDDVRSANRAPALVSSDLIEPGVFIFLGALQPTDALDYDLILSDFDRLLPLYQFVESGGSFAPYRDSPQAFQFRAGHNARRSSSVVTHVESQLLVSLRHNSLQQALFNELCKEYGAENVGTEIPNGSGGRIDAVAKTKEGHIFFEIKVGQSLQACIREALGQLLEYSYWPGSQRAFSLVIVGEPILDAQCKTYLANLSSDLLIPVSYRRVSLPRADAEPGGPPDAAR